MLYSRWGEEDLLQCAVYCGFNLNVYGLTAFLQCKDAVNKAADRYTIKLFAYTIHMFTGMKWSGVCLIDKRKLFTNICSSASCKSKKRTFNSICRA